MKNRKLSDYFNKKTMGVFGHGHKALWTGGIFTLLAATGTLSVAGGIALGVLAMGFTNKWEEQATGTPLWKPKITDTFGL
jgi:hypothetical protein